MSRHDIPFSCRDEGVVTDQEKLAALYPESDVFLDGSDFQGFGRCALEAMACGATCVLTDAGGVNEYARHEENTLFTLPGEPEGMAKNVITLLQNNDLRNILKSHALQTGGVYEHKQKARRTRDFFNSLQE